MTLSKTPERICAWVFFVILIRTLPTIEGGILFNGLRDDCKIEKAMLYAREPERVKFDHFTVTFHGDHKQHQITYDGGQWRCDCHFFEARGVCSHVMTLERLLVGSVKPAEAVPMPA